MSALGVSPTLEAIKEENDRLAKELDEKLTSIEQLKQDHVLKIKENESLSLKTKEKEMEVKRLQEEKNAIERAKNDDIQKIQDKLNEKNNLIIEKEKENSKTKQYIEANKRLIMSICGLISLGALAGAIFSPLFKKEFGILSVITGGVAVAIPFIEPLHVGIVALLVLMYVFYKMERKSAISLKTNENLVNAIQDIKDKAPSLYKKRIKPTISEWNKKYKGEEKVDDEGVKSNIDLILKDYERK
jgi:CHASE3 domain sensor protein